MNDVFGHYLVSITGGTIRDSTTAIGYVHVDVCDENSQPGDEPSVTSPQLFDGVLKERKAEDPCKVSSELLRHACGTSVGTSFR